MGTGMVGCPNCPTSLAHESVYGLAVGAKQSFNVVLFKWARKGISIGFDFDAFEYSPFHRCDLGGTR